VSQRIQRAFVTGAGGFVGRRVVERALGGGVAVRALVRRGAVGARPRAGLELCRGDVEDAASVAAAAAGCDVVFHCAWGGGDSLPDARKVNVDGTLNVLEAAQRAGARRVVHLSTMAVHGDRLPPVLTEECPFDLAGDAYGVSKAEGEQAALRFGRERGLEVVALRPTLVYGPGAPFWLVGYFERVKGERVALIDGGAGLANLIFVKDLVDAMFAAATRPGVGGEACLVSGPSPVEWREYLGHFARLCGKPAPPSVPLWRARLEMQFLRVYGVLTQRPRRLQGMDVKLMSQHCAVSIERAERVLGWKPATSLEAGMRVCEDWLRREGHLPPRPATAAAEKGGARTGAHRAASEER
jgi:nucleoside-diphosphate-sugar epimerase